MESVDCSPRSPTSANSHRASDPKLDLESRNLKFFKEDIFHLPYEELGDSSNYSHLRHVFIDEDDYEEFKQDLVDFHCLRSHWKDDRKKVSNDRKYRTGSSAEFQSLPRDVRNSPRFRRANTPGLPCMQDNSFREFEESDLTGQSHFKTRSRERLNSPPMMEFFQNDEHFQEFDRVFETFKNNRFSNNSLDKYRWSPSCDIENGRRTPQPEDSLEPSEPDEDDANVFDELKIDDIFADFFDNDVDFKNFEQEFQNFQKRRSRALALDKCHRNSVCDLIEDLKAFCDDDVEVESSKAEVPATEDNRLSLPYSGGKAGEWDFIFNKIRRHGKLASESSGTGRSDLTVTCDSQSGDYLLDDLKDSNRDTGYYSEAKYADIGEPCNSSTNEEDCQFTCHHKCLPLITLDCKSVSQEFGEDEGTVCGGDDTLLDDLIDQSLLQSSELASSEPATEKDETDSGYRSGTIPDEKLPRKPSQATLNRDELKMRILEYNKLQPGANFALREGEMNESNEPAFQGFIKVTLNLVRPISMSIGSRPPSIYEVLTQEHIVEQNTQNISFYMPRDTIRSIHCNSSQPTKEVVTLLLKKFHILDHPRKFALYEQELKNNKIVKLRRVKDEELPLSICLSWETESVLNHRLVLQENESGEIEWEAFSAPELKNFLRVLDREEEELQVQLQYKYKVMKRLILQRMKELRKEREKQKRASMIQDEASSTPTT